MTENLSPNIVLEELKAARSGAFIHIVDGRSVLRVDGRDTLDLLNRMSTNKVDLLQSGEARETLFTNEKGRIIDAALVLPAARGARLLLSPGMSAAVKEWLERYTIMDDCEYTDVTAMYQQISVFNPAAAPGGLEIPVAGAAVQTEISGFPVDVIHIDGVCGSELRVLCKSSDGAAVLGALTSLGIPVVHDQAFMLWRTDTLTPAAGYELTDRCNPLEAGAVAAVDFNKGCYIGQEVIARLDSYDKVQRRLVRVQWRNDAPSDVAPGSPLTADGKDAGFATTHIFDPEQQLWTGISCVRNAFAEVGTELEFQSDHLRYSLVVM